jgi:hypothetical protein
MRYRALILPALGMLALSSASRADLNSSAFTQLPSRFATQDLTLSSRGLGETCYSRDLLPDGTVCNPAFADEVKQGFLMGRLYVGNGYTALNTANQMIFQPMSREFLQNLFQNQNVTSFEGNASLVFATQNFSASFSPYRVQYFSEVHNPNYPVIAIQAAVERELEFEGGTSLGGFAKELKDFSIGAKLRLLDRNYVSGSFAMAQTLTDNPQSLLPVKEQYAAYLDPSIGWRPRIGKWKLWTSAGLINLGRATNDDPLYQSPVDIAGGVGVEPPIHYGRLRLGLDVINVIHNDGPASIFRVGSSYKIGIMEAMAGWNEHAITGGLQFGFQVVQAGIVYEFLRSEIDTGIADSRVSTEISIKL